MHVELADAPLEHERHRILPVGEAVHAERLAQVAAHQHALGVAGQLEDAAAGREDARILVTGEQACAGRREPVLEQLEEEAEAAAVTADGLAREPLEAVGVDHARAAVGADVERHQPAATASRARAVSQRSASSAAMQPEPAAVTAWR